MTVTETASADLSRTYQVVVPHTELAQRLDARIAEIQPEVRLKGFRPGKVPASHIKKMFGRSMMEEILQDTIDEHSKKTLDDNKVRAASPPSVELNSDAEGVAKGEQDLDFTMSVEIMPDFTPVDAASVTVERPTCPVSEDQVTEAMEELADNNITHVDKGDGASAEDKDAVVCDFVGTVDGEAFEGGSAESSEIVLGSGRLIPGFEDQLIGAKSGDHVTVKVTFPDDYPREDLQGKAAEFAVDVREVKKPERPEVGDALAQLLGLEDIAALREAVRKNLEAEHAEQSRAKAKRKLLDALDTAHDFPLPKKMVDAEFQQIWDQVQKDLQRDDLDPEDKDKPEDKLRTEYRAIAERRVRLGLVLAEIGQKAGVSVNQEELNRAIAMQARNYPGQERQIAEYFQKNPAAQQQLQAPIFEEKVVDHILELAEVTDVTVTREELFAEDEDVTIGEEV